MKRIISFAAAPALRGRQNQVYKRNINYIT